MLYEVVWRERPLKAGLQSAEALAGPTAASEGMSPFVDYLSSEGVSASDRALLLSDLERLSRSYSLAALERLGLETSQGGRRSSPIPFETSCRSNPSIPSWWGVCSDC